MKERLLGCEALWLIVTELGPRDLEFGFGSSRVPLDP